MTQYDIFSNVVEPKRCKCGCGGIVSDDKEYVLGHHMRVKNHFLGKHHTEEAKEKNRQSHLGKKHTSESIQKMIDNHPHLKGEDSPSYGKTHTDETKTRIGDAVRGVLNPRYGAILSDETKGMISKTRIDKGVAIGDKNPFSGKNHTLEARICMSALKQGINREDWVNFSPGDRSYILPINQCTHINRRFDGSEGHHITKSIVVFIPKGLHQSIRHNMSSGEGMCEINILASEYLYGGIE